MYPAETRTPSRNAITRRYYGPSTVSRTRRTDADPVVQNCKWRDGSKREWRRILRQTVPARCNHQERCRVYSLLSQGRRIPIAIANPKSTFDVDQRRNEI